MYRFLALLLLRAAVSLAQPAAPEQETAERFRAAQQHLQSGDLAAAISGFQEVLRRRPDLVAARVNLGLAYFTSGEYRRSAAEMERALAAAPGLPPANLFLGLSYVKLGAPEKAFAPLLAVVRADGSNLEARRGLAACYHALRRYKEAAQQHRAVFKLEAQDPETAWFNLGQQYLELARLLTDRMVWEFRTSSWAHRLAGDVFAVRARWDDAEEQYRKAISIEPAQPGLRSALAAALLRAGKREAAMSEAAREAGYTAAPAEESELARRVLGPGCPGRDDKACAVSLRAKPAPSAAERLLLGRVLFRLGDIERASDAFAAAVQAQPGSAETVYWLLTSYMRLSDGCFTELVTAFPESARARQLRAEAHELRGAYEEAAAEYQAAIQIRPDDPELHEALGEAYLALKQHDEARRALEQAVRLNPASGRTHYLLGRVHLAREDWEASASHLEQAVRYAPGLLEAHAALARVYVRAGNPAQAIPALKRAAPLDHYGDLHYLLFRAHTALGQKELAAKALARSRELRKKAFEGDRAKLAEINPVAAEPEQ